MVSEAKKRANAKSDKKNAKIMSFKFNKNTDKDILDHLANQENKNGYIKRIIREDIKKTKKD